MHPRHKTYLAIELRMFALMLVSIKCYKTIIKKYHEWSECFTVYRPVVQFEKHR